MLEIFGAPLYEKCSVFAEFFVAKGAQRQIVVVVVRCASKKTRVGLLTKQKQKWV